MKNDQSTCPNCGRPLAFNAARFCTSCGTPINADGTAAGPADAERATRRGARNTKIGIEKIELAPLDEKPVADSTEAPDIEVGEADDWEAATASTQQLASSEPDLAALPRAQSSKQPLQEASGQPGDETSPTALHRGKDDQMVNPKPPTQEKRTIVEEGTKLRGDLESDCPVVVNGRIAGDVQAPALTVSASGVVEGTARVGAIQCEGELAGEFEADRVELSGSVKAGTIIRAQTIEMKLTAKSGKKQLVFGDVEASAQPEDSASASASGEPAATRPSEAPASERAVPVNGRPSQPPPPAN